MDILSGTLAFRLSAAYRHVDRYLNRALRDLDLTHADLHILFCVFERGALRVTDIAAITGFEESTVSRLARELARKKLLRRRKHPHDARSHLLSAGTRALRKKIELEQIVRRAQERFTRDLPQADLDGLLSATDVLNKIA